MRGLRFRPLILPDRFLAHDKPQLQYDAAGLNAPQIVTTALTALGREATLAVRRERA